MPVLGYRVNICDRLRLWRADATESFDFYAFNIGDYYGAVEEKVGSETLSKVLYPNDGTTKGASASEAAALLRQLLASGHAAQPRQPWTGRRGLPQILDRSAQRHPPAIAWRS